MLGFGPHNQRACPIRGGRCNDSCRQRLNNFNLHFGRHGQGVVVRALLDRACVRLDFINVERQSRAVPKARLVFTETMCETTQSACQHFGVGRSPHLTQKLELNISQVCRPGVPEMLECVSASPQTNSQNKWAAAQKKERSVTDGLCSPPEARQ